MYTTHLIDKVKKVLYYLKKQSSTVLKALIYDIKKEREVLLYYTIIIYFVLKRLYKYSVNFIIIGRIKCDKPKL